MTKMQDVLDEITALRGYIAAEAKEVADTVQALTEQVAALRKRIDEGGLGATPADLDTILAQLQDVATGIQGIITPPATPSEGGTEGGTPAP